MNRFSNGESLGKRWLLGRTPPDTGRTPPDTGRTPPDTGRTPPDTGRTPPDTGRTGYWAQGAFGQESTRVTGVVVRGFVEAFGPLGDTELTVNVKWPAGSVGSMPASPGVFPYTIPAPVARPAPLPGPQALLVRKPPPLPNDMLPAEKYDQAPRGTAAKKAAKKAASRISARRTARNSSSTQ